MAAAYEIMKEVDYLDLSKEGAEAWDAALKRYTILQRCII